MCDGNDGIDKVVDVKVLTEIMWGSHVRLGEHWSSIRALPKMPTASGSIYCQVAL